MKKAIWLIPVLALLLQGCETRAFKEKFSEKKILADNPEIQTLDEHKQRVFSRYDTAFLGKQVSYSTLQQQLLKRKVSFHSRAPLDLDTVLKTLADQTRSSYRINTSVPGAASASAKPSQKETKSSVLKPQNVSFEGNFEQFMRYIAALYDVDVSLRNDNVMEVQLYKTYIINLDFYGENNTNEMGLDIGSNEAITAGGIKGKSENTFTSTFWADVSDMLGKYVSSGVYNIFKDVGSVTFSARPSEYAILFKVIKQFKEANNRQMVLSYKVYILDKSKETSFEAGLSLSNANTNTAFSVGNKPSATGLYLGGYTGGNVTVNAKLDALYKLTGSKILQSGTVIGRNNVAVPLNLSTSKNYVSSITGTQSAQIGIATTTVETSTFVTGISVILTPHLLSDGRIQLSVAFTKKDLAELEYFSTGQGEIQLPKVTSVEMYHTVDMVPGSIVMVGRFDLDNTSESRNLNILSGKIPTSDTTQTVVMVLGADYYNKPFTDNNR